MGRAAGLAGARRRRRRQCRWQLKWLRPFGAFGPPRLPPPRGHRPPPPASAHGSSDGSDHSARSAPPPSALPVDSPPPHPGSSASAHAGCRDPQYSDLTRFWELESGSDCGIFNFRGYRPITVSIVVASGVNRQPLSSAEGNSATTSIPYRHTENRIQLSVRTKLAQDLLTQNWPTLRDSLWFGYTQQSYWQLFTPHISRPCRAVGTGST